MKATHTKRFRTEYGLLLLILCTAATLRFYRLGDFSLSNDELSALVRTEYSSFSELIDQGIRVDAHPAGVQVFLYYWTAIAGTSEFALRFPFALAGVAAVYVLFLLGRRWFGTTCGLVAAAALAVSQLPVLYSQLARPYAPGLLFTLLSAYWWTRLLFPKEEDRLSPVRTAVAFGLSLAACAYTHYFSMLTAGLIAAGGLPFLGRKSWRPYFAGCLLSIILFLPHLGIFLKQLSYGGVGEWLGKPKPGYFWKYIDYCFNDTAWYKYLFAAICIVSAAMYYRSMRRPLLLVVCLAWFLLPYFVGHWYSVHRNPVLQYSTLLFAFSYLLVFLSGFLDEEKTRPFLAVLVTIVLAYGLFTLVMQQQYFKRNHFGVFSELVSRTLDWQKQHGAENVTTVYNVNSPKYVGYYFRKFNSTPSVAQYYVADDSSLARFRDVVDSSRTGFFVYGWSTVRNYPEAIEMVRQQYPESVARDTFFNSAVYLFGRDTTGMPPPLFITKSRYEKNDWGKEEELRSNDSISALSGKWWENLEGKEFSLTLTQKLTVMARPGNYVVYSAWFLAEDAADASLVMSFEEAGKNVLYAAAPVKHFNRQPGKWQQVLVVREVPADAGAQSEAKFYFWNPSRKKILVTDFSVIVREADYYR